MAYFKALCVMLCVQRAVALRAVETDTPVARVISLLQRLQAQITTEGKKEAAEYDKFACFCKEQADDKQYAIEKSDKKIEKLTASIEALEAEITELDQEITELGEDIKGLETKIDDEDIERAALHEEYLTMDKNHTEAISAIEEAIKSLKDSKKGMKDARVDLAQLEANPKLARTVTALVAAAAAKPGDPAKYQYKSNDIIATLRKLLLDFRQSKKDTDESEFQSKSKSEKLVLGYSLEKKFKTEAKLQKEELVAKKSEEKADHEKDKEAETTDRDADTAFMGEVETQCQDKAAGWDQRSKTRSAELTALAQAIETLKSGVETKYGANKQLAGLAQRSSHGSVSLLQLSGGADAAAAMQRALDSLDSAASRLGSSILSTVVAKAQLSEDQFGKVKGLINDLIAKLEAEATTEADSKSACDENMGNAVGSRDEQRLAIEENEATIVQKQAEKAELTAEIKDLSKEMAEEQKALSEATELRAEEKADNELTLADAEEGKSAVGSAIEVLSAFYDAQGASLLQGTAKGPADRDGDTFEDLAPEPSYEGDYKGKGEQGAGIIGILQVISSDFERTLETVGDAEKESQSKFEEFETSTKESITAKTDESKEKQSSITSAEEDIVKAKDAVETAKKLHEGSLEELEKLKVMCVEGEDSFEERKKKREQEIEALKGAMKILDEWK